MSNRRILAVTMSLALSACTQRDTGSRDVAELGRGQYQGKNLVMISLGNIGAQHMSLYGYKRKTTPKLDSWAKDALVFETTFSPASWTLPAGVSLFTSLQPYTHRVFGRRLNNSLSEGVSTLTEVLRANGYNTAAFTGGLDHFVGFPQMRGFETAPNNPNFTGYGVTLKQARDWLAEKANGKFFLFIHGYDAHCPFTATLFDGKFSTREGKKITVDRTLCYRGFKRATAVGEAEQYEVVVGGGCPKFNINDDQRKGTLCTPSSSPLVLTRDDMEYLEASYDEEVLSVDEQVATFLQEMGAKFGDNTVFVIVSEHGEMFAKHGRFGRAGIHRGTLYDEVVHVPFVIKTPDRHSARVQGLAQLIDVMPTLLEVVGIEEPTMAQGKSLLPLHNETKPVNELVFAGLPYNVRLTDEMAKSPFALHTTNEWVRNSRWKLIREVLYDENAAATAVPKSQELFELYDIESDPAELNNLWETRQDIALTLKGALHQWARWSAARALAPEPPATVPEDLIRDAEKHGYR